jgi:hypothetical protein
MIRILLCGEGPHDFGRIDPSSGDDRAVVDGWLQALVRRFVGGQLAFHIKPRKELILFPKDGDARKFRPLPAGHGRLALVSKLLAITSRYNAVIFMADADTSDVREWRRKYRDIRDGFARIDSSCTAITCLPKSASESWFLADEGAWQGLGLTEKKVLPRDPEEIWGDKHDPDSNYPHRFFARICGKAGVRDDRATRVDMATNSSLAVIEVKCPISFAPFHKQLTELVVSIGG